MKIILLLLLCICLSVEHLYAQHVNDIFKKQKVLIVVAHPDDESMMAATVFKLTHELHFTVDEAVITNGEGGYKYSLPASLYYHVDLSNENNARKSLPDIRKKELKNAGSIIGVNRFFFFNQKDAHYCLNESEPLDTSWNVPFIKKKLSELLLKNKYNYIFCLLPVDSTHGQHKAATLLLLQVVKEFHAAPTVLGVSDGNEKDIKEYNFVRLKNYEESKVFPDYPIAVIDRNQPFGYQNKLNYKIILDWEMSAQKSQGLLLAQPIENYELFWYFSINGEHKINDANILFRALHNSKLK